MVDGHDISGNLGSVQLESDLLLNRGVRAGG
jgi:hypothetical protein